MTKQHRTKAENQLYAMFNEWENDNDWGLEFASAGLLGGNTNEPTGGDEETAFTMDEPSDDNHIHINNQRQAQEEENHHHQKLEDKDKEKKEEEDGWYDAEDREWFAEADARLKTTPPRSRSATPSKPATPTPVPASATPPRSRSPSPAPAPAPSPSKPISSKPPRPTRPRVVRVVTEDDANPTPTPAPVKRPHVDNQEQKENPKSSKQTKFKETLPIINKERLKVTSKAHWLKSHSSLKGYKLSYYAPAPTPILFKPPPPEVETTVPPKPYWLPVPPTPPVPTPPVPTPPVPRVKGDRRRVVRKLENEDNAEMTSSAPIPAVKRPHLDNKAQSANPKASKQLKVEAPKPAVPVVDQTKLISDAKAHWMKSHSSLKGYTLKWYMSRQPKVSEDVEY